ncbi:MAG: sulfatase-like hydrolase/transferase, partial [Burkholderiales bacterium]
MRRLVLAVAGLVLAAYLPLHDVSSQQPARPNVLFAIADDWSFGHAGAYGARWVRTPAIDRVARDGLLFSR